MSDLAKITAKNEDEMEDFHDYEDEEQSQPVSKLDDYDVVTFAFFTIAQSRKGVFYG